MEKEYLINCLNAGMSTRDIEKECGLNHRTISYWIQKYNLSDLSKYQKKKTFQFEKIDTKEKAYLLGYILADTAIDERKKQVEFSCAISDCEILEFIAEVIDGNMKKDYTFDKKTRRFPRARMSKFIKDILKFTGGAKKSERHYPRIRSDLEKYMVQGFFDGDGCLTWGRRKDKNRIWQKICFNSQRKVLEGLQMYLIRNLGISSVVRQKSNENCYVLEFSNRDDVIRFCKHIYSDKDFIILKRKYLKYNALRLELEENGEAR